MDLKDQREIDSERGKVWDALLSREALARAVPGCEEMTGDADTGFDAVVVQKVGPVKATFRGTVTISDRVEGEALTLSGEGNGGVAGFAKGGAQVWLSDLPHGRTLLEYEVEAKIGGKLAQLGSRIITSFSKKLADQFFANLQAEIENVDVEPIG